MSRFAFIKDRKGFAAVLQDLFLDLAETEQRGDYHPEKFVDLHTAYVMYQMETRVEKMAALFHDVAKVDVTQTQDSGKVTSYAHAAKAPVYVKAVAPFVSGYDGCTDQGHKNWSQFWDVVSAVTENHMRFKFREGERLEQAISEAAESAGIHTMVMRQYAELFKAADDMNSFFERHDLQKDDDLDFTSDFEAGEIFWPAVTEYVEFVEDLLDEVEANVPETGDESLVVFRGLPGSGKTTLAKTMGFGDSAIFSADAYFVSDDGEYEFEGSKLGEAHEWCKSGVRSALERGTEAVAVHNTSTQLWEMIPYFSMAAEAGYKFHSVIVENRGHHASTKNIPAKTMDRMKDRFDVRLR